MSRYPEIDLQGVRTVGIEARASKVTTAQFGRPRPWPGAAEWLATFPDILAARDLRRLVEALRAARAARAPIVFMLGGHVMKCGVSPYLVDLLRRGWVTHFASNGSLSIHDVEVSLFGRTSEDVADTLERGVFGMVRETPEFMFRAFAGAAARGAGRGEGRGRALVEAAAPHREHSLLAQSW